MGFWSRLDALLRGLLDMRPSTPPRCAESGMLMEASFRLSTGVPDIDAALGGGLAPGLVEVEGPLGSGKRRVVWQIACHLAKEGGTVLYVDLEQSAPSLVRGSAGLPVDVRARILLVCSENRVAETIVCALVAQHLVDLVVIDSVNAGCHAGERDAPYGHVERLRAWGRWSRSLYRQRVPALLIHDRSVPGYSPDLREFVTQSIEVFAEGSHPERGGLAVSVRTPCWLADSEGARHGVPVAPRVRVSKSILPDFAASHSVHLARK